MQRTIFPQIVLLAAVIPIWSQPQIQSVVNAASFEAGLPTGGSLASVFVSVSGLKVSPGTYIAPAGQPLPLSLAGVAVTVNYAYAPILAVIVPSAGQGAYAQINFQVPMERNASLPPSTYAGVFSVAGAVMPIPSAPEWGGFFSDGNGYAVALHGADRSLVTPQNPASPGETIIAYADDFFGVWPPSPIAIPLPEGVISQLQPLFLRSEGYLYLQAYPTPTPAFPTGSLVSCTDTPALEVAFEGLAAGMTGVEEIDFIVPSNQQPGNWALFFNLGSNPNGSGGCDDIGGSSSPYVLLPVG